MKTRTIRKQLRLLERLDRSDYFGYQTYLLQGKLADACSTIEEESDDSEEHQAERNREQEEKLARKERIRQQRVKGGRDISGKEEPTKAEAVRSNRKKGRAVSKSKGEATRRK